jgi:hypothetical protein
MRNRLSVLGLAVMVGGMARPEQRLKSLLQGMSWPAEVEQRLESLLQWVVWQEAFVMSALLAASLTGRYFPAILGTDWTILRGPTRPSSPATRVRGWTFV